MSIRILFFYLFLGLFPIVSQAQFGGIPNSAAIGLSPQFPEANQEVTATLEAYSVDTTGANIAWYINDIEDTDERNERSITFTTGETKVPINIRVVATLPNNRIIDLVKTVTPSRVDLLIEADTTVPNHYAGRALPSAGSTIRIVAIPETNLDPDSLTYSWQIDNSQLYGGAIVGKNVATFEAPLRNSVLVRLDVSDPAGNTVARKLEEIQIVDPEIVFYQVNPLRGLIENALTDPYFLIADEVTIRGESYYMDSKFITENPLIEWKINNQKINNQNNNPDEITLRKSEGTGSTKIELHLRNLENVLQGVKESLFVRF